MKTLIIGGNFDGHYTDLEDDTILLQSRKNIGKPIVELAELLCAKSNEDFINEKYYLDIFKGNSKTFRFYRISDLPVDKVIEKLFNKYSKGE